MWPFSFYFWQYGGIAFAMPFLVLFYQGLGFNGTQIGLLAGISPLVTLISTPLWTVLADTTRQHRLILSGTLLGAILGMILYPLLTSFLAVLLVVILYSVMAAPISPMADSATMSMLGEDRSLYGRLRLGGTFGFMLSAPLAGMLVQSYGLRLAFWGCAAMYFLALVSSQMFVHESGMPAARPAALLTHRAHGLGLAGLLNNPRLLLFLSGALVGGFALALVNNFFFPYMKELGASQSLMGLGLSLGTLCEVPIMFFGNRLLKYFKAYPLFLLALALMGLRLVLQYFAASPLQAILIQTSLGATFPAMWIAGVAFADEHAPAGMSASAQGLFNAVLFGVGTALGGFAGGALLESLGARGLSLLFGLVTLVSVAVILLVGKWLLRNSDGTGRKGVGC